MIHDHSDAHHARARRGTAGFSVLEMVGVLSVLSILASMAVPSVVYRIKQANSSRERKSLETVADTFRNRVLEERQVPGESSWASFVAEALDVGTPSVAVSATQQLRAYLVDPEISINGSGTIPYGQTSAGSASEPSHVRVIFLSSLGPALPQGLTGEGEVTPQDFAELWNLDRGNVPAGWPGEWASRGDELFLERVDLRPGFCRLLVSDLSNGSTAEILIDGEAVVIPPSGWSAYYLAGTEVTLMKDGVVSSTVFLQQDQSLIYERGIWRGQLWEGRALDATEFAGALDEFRLADAYPGSLNGTVQETVVDAYYRFAIAYAAWADDGFPDYRVGHPVLATVEQFLEGEESLTELQRDEIMAGLQSQSYLEPSFQALLDARQRLAGLSGYLLGQ